MKVSIPIRIPAFSTRLPWWMKIALKMVLSRLPVGYGFWRSVGIFKLGHMQEPAYAYQMFVRHLERVKLSKDGSEFAVLELGPGDSLFSAVIACALGARETYLIDVGPFARQDMQTYIGMATFLSGEGLDPPDINGIDSLDDLTQVCGAHYQTDGLNSLRTVPDESVDFIWSQSVLQHIRKAQFLDTMRELRRVIRPNGACSHSIDLRDCLGGALNNLRFSDRLWERDFMARSGFYTNRIRFAEMLSLFREAGFEPEVLTVHRWDSLPTPRKKLSPPFKSLPDDDLCVSGVEVILRPA